MMSFLREDYNMSCIITGAGAGIGKATAIELTQKNMYSSYALLGRNMSALESTKNQMLEICPNAKVNIYEIDFESPENLPQIVDEIYNDFGSISCLLNIAGYTEPLPLLMTTLESFEKTYRVNVFSPFMLIRECVKYMKTKGGKILNVASTAGMTPRPGWLSYASSKASVISMSQTLTEELDEYNIRMYCISPGRCATALRKKLAPDEDPTTIMQPEEVAEVISRLISKDENCLDGQNIVIRKKH